VNILLNSTSDFNKAKIADFGLSTEFSNEETKMLSNKCGTILYMAPEFSKEQIYSKVKIQHKMLIFFLLIIKPVDIWASGIIMYEILNKGIHPIYTRKMTREEFCAKLINPEFLFPDSFSKLLDFYHNIQKIS